MSDLIAQAAQALDKKPIGMNGPKSQEEVIQNISNTAKFLDNTPLRQGSNQFNSAIAEKNYNEQHGIVPEREIPKTAHVREKLQPVDISDALISGAVNKLNSTPKFKF